MARTRRIMTALALVAVGVTSCDDPVGLARLDAALERTAEVSHYRVGLSTGQQVQVPGLGIDVYTTVDEENPDLIGVVTPEGTNHALNVASVFGLDASTEQDTIVELWGTGDEVLVDTTRLATFEAQNPGAQLGPLRPGVTSLDRTQIDEILLSQSLLSSGAIDLARIVDGLAPALGDLAVENVAEEVYTGALSYDELLRSLGGDVDRAAQSAAAGLTLTVPVDPEGLAAAYVDAYANTETKVAIEVIDGVVSVVSFQTDLTQAYQHLFSSGAFGDLGLSGAEIRQTEDLFVDGYWVLNARVEFFADDSLELAEPPESDGDSTAEWLRFLGSMS